MNKKIIILTIISLFIGANFIPTICGNINNNPNQPPEKPTITGKSSGKPGTYYEYKLISTDPEGDNISYCINWGDNTGEICIGPYLSGVEASATHTWSEEGTYTIKAKAKDTNAAESEWATLEVSMPKTQSYNLINQLILMLLERFPFLQSLLSP